MPDKVIYISGQMSGLPDFNFPAFNRWAEIWRSRGYKVINPAEHELGEYRDMLVFDMKRIREEATAIFMLESWNSEKAVGSFAEYGLARWLGLKIHYEITDPEYKKETA